jgi:DNA-binding transcriptional regulator YiaG
LQSPQKLRTANGGANSAKSGSSMSPAQCRAARALLDWSQTDFADRAEVHLSTVTDFETGKRQPRRASLSVMRRAMETAGVVFLDDGKVHGVTAPKPAEAPPLAPE